MRSILCILACSALFLLGSCSTPVVDSEQDTLSVENSEGDFKPYPTLTDVDSVLDFADTGSIDLKNVFESPFHYLDSEEKVYATGSLSELMQGYSGAVVYFYPKDGTPNCTIQALDFSMMLADFRKAGYEVIGVSKDNLEAHKAFADRNELKIKLLQDSQGDLLEAFGSKGELQTYGNGDDLSDIIRSTYVIDGEGEPVYAFRDVVAKGHARRIYELLTGNPYPLP